MELLNNAKGNLVEGFCLLKSVQQKTTQKGQNYLDMVLSDATGEVSAKLWDYSEQRHGSYANNDIIKVRGTLDTWNNAPQLRVEKIRKANENDAVKYDDLIEVAPYSAEQMYNALVNIVNGFSDNQIKEIVLSFLQDDKEALLFFPAAVKLHHSMRGGLLYHTLSIARMCEKACEIYSFLDKDLLIAGAILHDLAKIDELQVSSSGYAEGYTAEGELIGHLVKGALNIEKKASELSIDREIVMLLQHMVISHHGEPEFGSAIRPMFPEAHVLSLLDELDASMFEFAAAIEDVPSGGFSQRQWALDQRKIYNHGRGGYFKSNIL